MDARKTKLRVNRIIKRYGPVIDLRTNPETIIDIIHRFADDPDGGGQPCAGTPPPPPPPPPPSSGDERVTNEEIMKVVLKLSRDVSALRKAQPVAKRIAKR